MNLTEYDCNSQGKKYFNITISNCLNLININNILEFNKKAVNCIYILKIYNCPLLEFIESYNYFSNIKINFHQIKVIDVIDVIDVEKYSLLKN